jgi:acyl-ACP thioesterase
MNGAPSNTGTTGTFNVFSEKRTVRFGNIDRSNTLTVASTFDFFQEAAISHAEALGVGRDMMTQAGRVWVLSRIGMFMERRPRCGEILTVRSWPRGLHKLFAVRDYDILDAGGASIVRGRSGWLILDMEKRRPLRPETALDSPLPLNEGLDALPAGGADNEVPSGLAARLNAENPAAVKMTRAARYSDIDYNGHMNNARYIQWIQDALDPEIFENARQIRLDINYLAEVKPGEIIDLLTLPFALGADAAAGYPGLPRAAFAVEGRRGGENVFRAELWTGA